MIHRLRVGLFLARKYVAYSNRWMSALVIFVMTLTFINMVAVTGILRGFTEGNKVEYRTSYSGDLLLTKHPGTNYIEHTPEIESFAAALSGVKYATSRYIETGTVESGFQTTLGYRNDAPDIISADIVGIDPLQEDLVTDLSRYVTEGSYLSPQDAGFILIGSDLLEEYSPLEFAGFETISGVKPGSKVRLRVGNATKDMIVKGILDLKARPTNRRVYMLDTELRSMTQRSDYSSDEISITVKKPGEEEALIKAQLLAGGWSKYALIRTSEEAQGKLTEDLEKTFAILSNVIGSIGVLVASITIFVVIFITAITRRRFIGILKGIGIDRNTIEASYMILSVFYTAVGICIGVIIIYGILVPYFAAYPISFPFNDGVLVADASETIYKIIFMLVAAVFASYVPTSLIARRNTLDAILGR